MSDAPPTPVRALFFDMDGTLLTRRPGAPSTVGPYNLFHILEEMAIQKRIPALEIKSRMNRLREKDMFWEWSEFIVALELDPVAFWDFAYHREIDLLGPTTPDLLGMMQRLRAAGFQLYITSNNPVTGILHKLRILGLGDMHGAPLFSQLLGFSDIRALKTESEYWLRVLARTGWAPEDVAVIGDNYQDDFLVPRLAGISRFVLHLPAEAPPNNTDGEVHVVTDFADVETVLMPLAPTAT